MKNNIHEIFVKYEGNPNAKLWVIGESPGDDDEIFQRPFVGMSGTLLRNTLDRHGIKEDEVFFANLSHYRPLKNKFEFLLGSEQLKQGQAELENLLREHQPNLIVALGAWPFNFFTGKCQGGTGIQKYRGSILPCRFNQNIKVLGSLHPAFVSRDESYHPMFDFDIGRAAKERAYPDVRKKYQREFVIDPSGLDLENWVQVLSNSDRLAIDIESIKNSTSILCVGFAPRPDFAVVIPWKEGERKKAIERILSGPSKKTFHFGTYDIEQLRLNGLEVNNYWWDTIVGQHLLNPELPRSLAFLTSVYTDEPYYKEEGRGEIPDDAKVWSQNTDPNKLYIYNAKDCCYTSEVQLGQEQELEGRTLELFFEEMELQDAAFEIMRNGLPVDQERRQLIEKACLVRWGKCQGLLNVFAEGNVNVNSPKQMKALLYDKLDLPLKKKKDGKITTDEDAIVSLITHTVGKIYEYKTEKKKQEWESKLVILKMILEIRGTRKILSSYVLYKVFRDGKVHSTVSVASTDTARWSMSTYVDGSGLNAQTLPRDPIDIPDELFVKAETYTNMLADLEQELEEKEDEAN